MNQSYDYFTGHAWSVSNVGAQAGWFNSGENTLSVEMVAADGVQDGVRVEVSGNASGLPSPGNIYIYYNNYLGAAQDGTQYFVPGGDSGGGGISQSFPTSPGTTYELVFYRGSYEHYGLNAVLGVTIDTNYYTFGETDGTYGNLDWRRVQILFTASSNLTTLTFSDLTGFSADDNFVDNVQVIPPGLGTVAQGTDRFERALPDDRSQRHVPGRRGWLAQHGIQQCAGCRAGAGEC